MFCSSSRGFVATLILCLVVQLAESMVIPASANDQTRWRNVLRAPSYGLAWNPKNPRTIYVGGDARALYRSFDGGETWDTMYVEFKGSGETFLNVVVHPVDTNVIIIGGSRFGTIRRSTDCGNTWSIVLSSDVSHTFNGESIIIDKANSDILYAADFNSAQIFTSTDRGASWSLLSALPLDSSKTPARRYYPCSITQRSDSTNVFYLGCLSSVILRSEDHGRTWLKHAKLRSSNLDEPEIPQIHFSTSNPKVGYAITTYFYYQARPNGGVYTTIDGGLTWKEMRFHDTAFWSMDTRPLPGGSGDEIVLGGFTEYFDTPTPVPGSGIILRSLDNGSSWWNYQPDIPYEGGPDHSIITLRFVGNSYSSQRLIAATVGGTCVLEPEGLTSITSETFSNNLFAYRIVGSGDIQVFDKMNLGNTEDTRFFVYDLMGRSLSIRLEAHSGGTFLLHLDEHSLGSYPILLTVIRSGKSCTILLPTTF